MIFITKLINYNNYNSFSGCDVVVTAQMAPLNGGKAMKLHTLGSLQTMSYSTHQDRAPVRSIGNINAKDYVQGQRTIAGTMVFAMFHEHWMTPLLKELAEHVSDTDIWSDELPALNLTISMANEYGYKSNMAIYGVKFIDDGGVMSINDLYTENTLQYVATGIQPLKTSGQYEHSYKSKGAPFKISEYKPQSKIFTFDGVQTYDKKWFGVKRDIIIDRGEMIPIQNIFVPPIYVSKPTAPGRDFVINIYTGDKKQPTDITNIFLTDKETGDKFDTIKDPINNMWAVEVPEGEYIVGVTDIYNNVINEVLSVKVDSPNATVNMDGYPIIVEVGHTNVRFLPNNNDHDYVAITRIIEGDQKNGFQDVLTDEVYTYEMAKHIFIGQSNSKEILIENLKPDTKYSLYTYKSKTRDKSLSVTFKTFALQKDRNELLKEYVHNNFDKLLSKNLINFDYDSIEYKYTNIVDSIIQLPESNEKTELLFFAVKLQNELNRIFNESGLYDSVLLDRTNPFINKFVTSEAVQSLVIYKKDNHKSYYVAKVNANTDYEYNGKSNTRYYVQPILDNNKKGSRNDFVCFTDDQKKYLEKYLNVNNLANMSFINYKTSYDNYGDDIKSAIKASNNMTIYKDLVPAPYAEVHNGFLTVDVNYGEYNIGEEYYLCIATPQDALDYTPIRKIKISSQDSSLLISNYRTGIIKNGYYLIWIQDKNFYNISEPFILSTHADDIDIADFHEEICTSYIKDIKSRFANTMYSSYLNTLILDILSEDVYKYKDIDYFILQSLIRIYGEQFTPYSLDDITLSVVNAISSKNTLNSRAYRDGDYISFKTYSTSNYIACVNITAEELIKTRYKDSYDINNTEEGYTILYLADSLNSFKSGYVLINNATKEVYSSNIELEMIKDGR